MRPRVVLLANDFEPPWAEAGKKNAAELVRRLRDRFRFLVLGLGPQRRSFSWQGARVELFGSPGYTGRFARLGYPLGCLELVRGGAELLRRAGADLVVGAMETASTASLVIALGRMAGPLPLVQWLWSDWYEPVGGHRHWLSEQLPQRLLNGRALSAAVLPELDLVLGSSRYLCRRAEAAGARQVRWAPSGVDLQAYRPRPPARGRFSESLVVASIGHMTYAKGTSVLLEALRPLLDRGEAHLLLAVAYQTEESPQAEALRDHPHVTLHGVCDPAELYAAADVTVVPRRHSHGTASYPNVITESLACGTPVVTTPMPAIDELIVDGGNGLLVPAGEVEALRGALERLRDDRDLRTGLASRARASVEHLDWERAAAGFGDALDEVLAWPR